MSKFITTKRIEAELEDLIKSAKYDLYLISYNFSIDKTYYDRLLSAADRGVRIHVIYGKTIDVETRNFLNQLPKTEIRYLDKLHAKLYINETKCLVGSMNFSAASSRNGNKECAILIKKNLDMDKPIYEEAFEECMEIIASSEIENELYSVSKKTFNKEQLRNAFKSSHNYKSKYGFCIRCKSKINSNPHQPLCYNCFQVWSQFNDPYYRENYCHTCGSNSEVSLSIPECKSCYHGF